MVLTGLAGWREESTSRYVRRPCGVATAVRVVWHLRGQLSLQVIGVNNLYGKAGCTGVHMFIIGVVKHVVKSLYVMQHKVHLWVL